ncbi:ArsR/SmtB family transcription factor [Umezawaea tangerina]|uniref:ArsR family transcriptional regulator n=1 Tax=Umezawaea tangerina TaxID=84725 RepID=A0A2T0TEC4_9PSEU|nr:helix-turn-helix domain-containing protein [Umezawaea tangerina]PRY44019.1 ArsR family transcriptional regulator [Umezawaea tangerina]
MEELANLAALLADRTRAAFCVALLDGRAWTAGELAAHAGVAASTASEHLGRLVAGGLLVQRRQGRHRYVQLADQRVAQLVEDLLTCARPAAPPSGLRAVGASAAMARGRTCYDHFAGRLGVGITDAMTAKGYLSQTGGFALTDTGLAWLTGPLGADGARLRAARRPLSRPCLDWTERRTHLAGAAGAHVHQHFQERGWVRRIGTTRAVRVTPAGAQALRDLLDLDMASAGMS